MKKINIKLSIASFLLIFIVFILAGCSNKKEEKNQSQNQVKEQIQSVDREESSGDNGKKEGVDDKMKGNPSAEMTEICNEKAQGDSCEISLPNRDGGEVEGKKMSGTCKKIQDSETLICTPSNMPQGGPRGEK